MDEILRTCSLLLGQEQFDALAVAVIDFNKNQYDAFECHKNEEVFITHDHCFYDLASVTKPLTNSLSYFLAPDKFDENMLLCLNHRAGIPAWGLLPKVQWREQILGYSIRESETLYSDFSALRVMLELNKKGIDQKKLCTEIWDAEVMNWLDLPIGVPLLQFGYDEGEPNLGKVHDPNARNLGEFCSHAGLFGTIHGVAKTLLNYQKKTDFISKVHEDLKKHTRRFAFGWDRVENPENTLAGAGCGKYTFGHLGFTGTSVWVDPERMRGHVILSNATKHFWYEKQGLNDIRRSVGQLVWKK
jgi:hypothetical protein